LRTPALACLFAIVAVPVAAQDDAVVTTATRAAQPSLEVPASVDRIYADEIREGRPQVNLSESLGRVPGLVMQNRQNYAQDLQITSRGFGARSTFGVRGIRLISDGIPATFPDGQGQAATFNLGSARSIEVLRGPFSSLYGNASGGVISVTTEDGPEIPAFNVDYFAGSYKTQRLGAKYGGQWGAVNALGSMSHFETNGYRDHSAAQREQLNGKLRYTVSEDTSLILVANSLRQPQAQDPGGLTRAQVEQDPRQVVATAITFNTRKTVLQDQGGLTLNHRLSGAARVQASAYAGERWVEQYLNIPLATQNAPTHGGGVVALDQGFGGGALRFFDDTSLFGKPMRISLGAEYDRLKERRKGFINNNGVGEALKRDQDDLITSTDFYAQGEWKFAEPWALHAGARSSQVKMRATDYFIVPGNPDDSGERTYRATTPVAGLLFRLDRNTSFYANLGRGFETPTILEVANSNAGSGLNLALDASTSRHAEVGMKTVVPGWVRLNAALFDIVTRNEIVVDRNAGGRATFKNVGHTDRNGLELSAETVIAGPFEARMAYTYLKAVFREGFDTVTGTPATPVTISGGSLIPGVPRNQLYGELRYRQPGYFAQLEALRKARVAVNDQNSEYADGYTSVNLVGGLVQEGNGWRLTEFVRIDNLADRRYVGSVIVNEANNRYYEPSPLRNMSVGVQARLQF
jgi:iron complex outermembrane recepter protein